MGNCLRTSVKTDHCSTGTRPLSTGTSNNYSSDKRLSSTSSGTNFSSVGGGTVSSSSAGTFSGVGGGGGADDAEFPSGRILSTPNLRVFSFAELKSATKNFKNENILGEGGFGKVFKGFIDDKTTKSGGSLAVAIKKLNPESMQGIKEWEAEVKFLGRLSHPNLVKLIGYCWEDSDLLLVYEFMPRGSLENHLFRRNAQPLSWEVRMNILIGVARGLAFLHTSERQIIYRDFKASNILLDLNYNAKLSDFGLAKHGPLGGDSHVTTRIMGTNGYAAPEYVATGHLYVKSDVYGFGVVLVEMLTGMRAMDTNRPTAQHKLVDWVKPRLTSRRKLAEIMDKRLDNQYPQKAARQAAVLANKCLEPEQKGRPSMKEVVETLEQIEDMKDRTRNQRAPGHTHSIRPQKSPVHPRPDVGIMRGNRSPHSR